MPDNSEILNIYEIEIQRCYFKMETVFDRELAPGLPDKYECCLRDYKKNLNLKFRCLKTVKSEWLWLALPQR